jgi:hypothetical protein
VECKDTVDTDHQKVGLKVFDLERGMRRDYSWEEGLLNYWQSKVFSQDGHFFVLGFRLGFLLTVLEIPFADDEPPRLRDLMTFPKSHQHLNTVQWFETTKDNRLKAVIIEGDGSSSTGGPQSILTSFDLTFGWEDASSIIDRDPQYWGPSIEHVLPLCALRETPGSAPRSKTCRADSRTEEYWRCKHWKLTEEHGSTLQERKYLWI